MISAASKFSSDLRRAALVVVAAALACSFLYCFFLHRAADSRIPRATHVFPSFDDGGSSSLDADVMWFRDPFPHFHPDADFQIACDHFSGRPDDIDNKPNGGFKFVRSNNRSIEFYKFWYTSREVYPGLHDQDVLNIIKNDSLITEIGIKLRFLDTVYFGGFCEPSKNLTQVCTMHANCCFGLNSKLHDLRILLEDWKYFVSLPLSLKPSVSSWRVPQNCSLDSLQLDVLVLQPSQW